LPGALFDSVAENLLQNALAKRQHENGIEISVNLTVDRDNIDFSVRDTGQAITPSIADALFREPVQSEFGLGIGLYHAAKQAEEAGYLLNLAENRPGAVAFRLARRN
jgi:sensor histidine kinase regulating citrate/malate metabolism